jgi:hypothetical protein
MTKLEAEYAKDRAEAYKWNMENWNLTDVDAAFVGGLHAERERVKGLVEAAASLNQAEGYGTEGNEHWDALRKALAQFQGEK